MMGRPMERSPSNGSAPDNSTETPRQRALALMAQKDELEKQLKDQQDILVSNNSNMTTPLVDAEGFPRADIDVYTVRYARVRWVLRPDL